MGFPFFVSGLLGSPAGSHITVGGYGAPISTTMFWVGGLASLASTFSIVPLPGGGFGSLQDLAVAYCVEEASGWQGGAAIVQKAC